MPFQARQHPHTPQRLQMDFYLPSFKFSFQGKNLHFAITSAPNDLSRQVAMKRKCDPWTGNATLTRSPEDFPATLS